MESSQLTLSNLHLNTTKQQKIADCLANYESDATAGNVRSSIVPSPSQQQGQSKASLRVIFCEAFLIENGIQPKHLIHTDLTRDQARNVIADYVFNRKVANPDDAYRWLNYLRENPNDLTLRHIHVINGMISVSPIDENDVANAVHQTIDLASKKSLSLF